MLLNCRVQGGGWKKHGITHDRVVARNRQIADGSAALWAQAERLIQELADAGHLPPKPPG